MNQLNHKNAVITGAGGGIGRALACALADEGCRLAISDINPDALLKTEALLKEKQATVYAQVLDVADQKAMEAYPEKVVQHLGGVDILINNAGVAVVSTVEEHTIEDYQWLMGINFWGMVYGCKFFLPHLKKDSRTFIVNISSIFGLVAMPHLSSYSAAKFAVSGFSDALAHELEKTRIRVMTVYPGGVKTGMARNARFRSTPAGKSHEQFSRVFETFSMSTPESTARAIVRGLKKGKRRARIGPDAVMGDILKRILPVGHRWLIRLISALV